MDLFRSFTLGTKSALRLQNSGNLSMSQKAINVLLIEENAEDARVLQEMLTQTGEGPITVTCAERLSAGLDAWNQPTSMWSFWT